MFRSTTSIPIWNNAYLALLAMIRPHRHPKTGVYWLRKVVLAPLRAIIGKRELVASLGTKDCTEARQKAGPIAARFEAIIASARNGGGRLTQPEIEHLCREWHRTERDQWWNHPGEPSSWATYRELLHDQLERFEDPELENDPDTVRRVLLKPEDRTEAAALLEAKGYAAEADTVTRMAECLFQAKLALADEMELRAEAVRDGERTKLFPTMASTTAPIIAPSGITMEALVDAWGAEARVTGRRYMIASEPRRCLQTFLAIMPLTALLPMTWCGGKRQGLQKAVPPRPSRMTLENCDQFGLGGVVIGS
jgi:hypothetical protein